MRSVAADWSRMSLAAMTSEISEAKCRQIAAVQTYMKSGLVERLYSAAGLTISIAGHES
jgi:hypothetical protein